MSQRAAVSATRLAANSCRRSSLSLSTSTPLAIIGSSNHHLPSLSPSSSSAASRSPTARNYHSTNHSLTSISCNHLLPCESGISNRLPRIRQTSRATSRVRAISSTHCLYEAEKAAAESKEGEDDDDDDDACPPWQNPLHHNNPDYTGKVLAEDFVPGEEMPTVPLPPFSNGDGKVLAAPHIHDLADQIVHMNMIEIKELVDRIGDHFGFEDGDAYGGDGEGSGEAAAEEVVVEEKTAFDLKLMAFEPKSKIKVIKEVRAVTSLGLKEAKELVEGAPTVVKKDIKMEEAEELKAKLEALGATVEIV
mmetsp:Transcript_8300/g.15542  ORF Transcript_8300/g.15542 Transcript_8300/m.15542 type:complete len:306 (+) Transcript_8300:71-988(+)|eukprot:CAMPEP_0196130022 /NCGR_PEP_ID=MMETSP0910-20130528/539_1 /TAXON_ID=49265 /ORGANISM="Thalassiosira rotula, Strain GSO102" /LENGTH=305 /DNA_ID=CAMNT_0041389245 /DNA_START=45 /DNA_END=962 /DNA_ORIENTATION=+